MENEVLIRKAVIQDISQMQKVRNEVLENQLSSPGLVTENDYYNYITGNGKGWVAIVEEVVIGFAIVALTDNNIWALFVDPKYDKQGIGRRLHKKMVDWYFNQTNVTLWLTTAPGTRAESFYIKAGWKYIRLQGKEMRFEMTFRNWRLIAPE